MWIMLFSTWWSAAGKYENIDPNLFFHSLSLLFGRPTVTVNMSSDAKNEYASAINHWSHKNSLFRHDWWTNHDVIRMINHRSTKRSSRINANTSEAVLCCRLWLCSIRRQQKRRKKSLTRHAFKKFVIHLVCNQWKVKISVPENQNPN